MIRQNDKNGETKVASLSFEDLSASLLFEIQILGDLLVFR